MQATRRLLASSSGLQPKLLLPQKLILPPPSFLETSSSALQGAWSVLSDQASRDAYEQAIANKIIKDEVLSRASNGSVLLYSLFHNLYQAPFFKDYKFDAKEFVRVVGPALENFHETLGSLQNTLIIDAESEKKELDTKLKQSDDELLESLNVGSLTEVFLGSNEWKRKATDDPESLAAHFSNMTAASCFDACYYTSKLAASFATAGTTFVGCTVGEVALLNARAMVIRDDGNEAVEEYDEFRATTELDRALNVGAQLEVLYEITSTHKPITGEGEASPDEASPDAAETITTTNLAVAAFEGWLSGGPKKDLRWKICHLREASEFPYLL
jgi:hypothetical protein